MAADPPPSPASSDRRRRRLTKLEQTQRQHQHSSSSNNSNGRGDPALQGYQRKLAQALFDAEQNLELERHTRLYSQEEVSLDYNNDDNSLVETASLDSASASFMDNRSATLTPMDKMKKNLIRNSKKKSVGSPSDVVVQSTFDTDDDDDDDDTKTNLDETVFSGYTSTVVSEYTRDTTTAYTRDTSLQRSRDEDETTLFTKDSIKPRVRFDSDTKFGTGDYDNDNDDDNETSDTFDVIKNIVHCRPYWGGGASSSANNNYYTGVVGGIMDDSDTITTRDDATRSVRSTTTGSIFSGGSSSRGEDDYSAMMDTIDTRQTGRDSYWTMESKLDDSTLVTGYTKDTTQSDAELTAKVVASSKPWCSAFTPGGCIGNDDDQDTNNKDNETSARLGGMLFISCVDDYSAMDTIDTGLINNLSGGKYDCSMLNEYKRKPAQDQNEDQNDDATAANVANLPWVCATDFMGGIMDNIEDTRCEEPIARGTMVGSMLSITTAKGCHGKRRDDISAITRGTANSTESDVSQLTESIKQIMAYSARDRQREEDVKDDRARNLNECASSNKTLAEKLDAVSRGRTHTSLMSERRSFDELNNNSYGERFEVVIKSRSHEAAPVTSRGRNEATKPLSRKFDIGKTYTELQQREEVGSKSSFWQGDGVWSSDQSTAFGTALTSLPQINVILREYDEAHRASRSADASKCWSAAIDASSGKTYYYNNKTKETSWSMPNGYIGSVRSDNRGKTSVQEQSKMNTHEKNAVNNVISQYIHLSRARTQKQRGGGAFIEERGVTIGSRGSAGRQLDEKQLQTVPAVNALRQLQREESPQYSISQAKTSRGRLPSEKQQSNHHQQRHHPATTQDQEKKTSRRRRFSLFRKKNAEENTTANTITNTKASPSSAIRPTTANNNKSYNKVTTTIDPGSPNRTVIDFSWI